MSTVAHVALAPQIQFELLEVIQQQNTSWTRHQVVCTVFKEIVQENYVAKAVVSKFVVSQAQLH